MTAPRGKGVEHLVSDFAALSTSERQSGSGRGTPWSHAVLPKTKPTHIDDKRGAFRRERDYINVSFSFRC